MFTALRLLGDSQYIRENLLPLLRDFWDSKLVIQCLQYNNLDQTWIQASCTQCRRIFCGNRFDSSKVYG
jgi:hypothetical protein